MRLSVMRSANKMFDIPQKEASDRTGFRKPEQIVPLPGTRLTDRDFCDEAMSLFISGPSCSDRRIAAGA